MNHQDLRVQYEQAEGGRIRVLYVRIKYRLRKPRRPRRERALKTVTKRVTTLQGNQTRRVS